MGRTSAPQHEGHARLCQIKRLQVGRLLRRIFLAGLGFAILNFPSEIPALAQGNGEQLALRHCGRCHVVSDANRFGGIDSSPSFAALRSLATWREKLSAFWTVSPHAAVIQIEGVTEPFAPERPSPMAPLELSVEELKAIQAFVETVEPKDLSARP